MRGTKAKTFADLLWERRVESLRWLASVTGVHEADLSRMKNGQMRPRVRANRGRLPQSKLLARHFRLSEEDLLRLFE